MRPNRHAFTLIELLVVISIIALLLAILMPSLQKIRKQAKHVVCRSNLKQWGLVWAMYTEDTGTKFPPYLADTWMQHLLEYSSNTNALLYCPMTTKTVDQGAPIRYAVIGTAQAPKGSYAINEWVYDSDASGNTDGRSPTDYWRNTSHKGLSNVPVMGDGSVRSDIQPFPVDSPPSYEGEPRLGVGGGGDEMRLYCIDRHDGAINILFMDWTARPVGLKELWTLKWHCSFDVSGAWTKAGGVQPEDWPLWMRSFKEY
jgi:prepilin-type N-terminal cleavage/methylation domain-containing protein/prepilin-type processing-associated H-X9-DG protein